MVMKTMEREVDVLVVGGGPAGVGAALAAARNGAETLVVEQFNCLGGVATAGGHGHISKFNESGGGRRIVGGIADEIARRVVAGGFGTRNAHGIWFEVEGQCEFEDNICYGSFFVDIHCIDGPGMDPTVWRPPKGFKYQIPYRVLVPKGIENLLTAGRCVSCTHIALGSIRVMVQCIGTGEAAGTAAALSLKEGTAPRQLDIGRLQSQLRSQGGILSEGDIEKAAEDA
jgi:succinate dehydrogenase/fumarate reductase flavoprotein subunit